jgi:hypothetical protein
MTEGMRPQYKYCLWLVAVTADADEFAIPADGLHLEAAQAGSLKEPGALWVSVEDNEEFDTLSSYVLAQRPWLEIESLRVVSMWGVRMVSPGFSKTTDWALFNTLETAERYVGGAENVA